MNTLLIGGGGREHALALAISNSKSNGKLYCAPGNPGIYKLAEKGTFDHNKQFEVFVFAKRYGINLIVVGPEQPLANGLADTMRKNGVVIFGPSQKAAMLETSKSFAKEFMLKYSIPTSFFKSYDIAQKDEATEFIRNNRKYPIVIKADGLAAGKGVMIANDEMEALETLELIFSGKFGSAGNRIVIEEFLNGEEASILAITDGKDFVTLASSQDHKRIFDGDKGPNTGGMGAYSPAPIVTQDVLEKVKTKILKPAIDGMINEGRPFIGCLYAGLMIDKGEPKVVEFNVRFGDPETQAVLSSFEGDFLKLLYSAATGKLDLSAIDDVSARHSCCVVMASEGYPGTYPKGQIIYGIEEAEKLGINVFQAGTELKDGELMVSGGRVLGVTATGESLNEAIEKAYNGVNLIQFDKSFYRTDIGARALKI